MMISELMLGDRFSCGFAPGGMFSVKYSGLMILPDVVEVGHDAAGRGIEPDGLGARLGEVGHEQAVMIGPGSLHRHLLEQRMVEIGELEPRDRGGDLERALHQRQDGADDEGGAQSGPDAEGGLASPARDPIAPNDQAQHDRAQSRLRQPTAKPALIRSGTLAHVG